MLQHTASGENYISLQFIDQPWEQLRGVPVDREGEYALTFDYDGKLELGFELCGDTEVIAEWPADV